MYLGLFKIHLQNDMKENIIMLIKICPQPIKRINKYNETVFKIELDG